MQTYRAMSAWDVCLGCQQLCQSRAGALTEPRRSINACGQGPSQLSVKANSQSDLEPTLPNSLLVLTNCLDLRIRFWTLMIKSLPLTNHVPRNRYRGTELGHWQGTNSLFPDLYLQTKTLKHCLQSFTIKSKLVQYAVQRSTLWSKVYTYSNCTVHVQIVHVDVLIFIWDNIVH